VTPRIVHVPSDVIASADPVWGAADPARQVVDSHLDGLMDKLAADFGIARGAAD
jgi:hypothetical protein